MSRDVRVLVVDDSAIVRTILSRELGRREGIEVVGSAADATSAKRLIAAHRPDLLTLDLDMPGEHGLALLRRIMAERPMPVVVVSAATQKGAHAALECLEAGAIAALGKPAGGGDVRDMVDELARVILGARTIRVTPTPSARPAAPGRAAPAAPTAPVAAPTRIPPDAIVAIGASTGGTRAIAELLRALPAHVPPMLIAQHMPKGFTAAFAERLDGACSLRVREAEDRLPLEPGLVVIAPGDRHLELGREGGRLVARVRDGEKVLRHRPSVEVLFDSVARVAGASALGIMLTGMGGDGATAMRRLQDAGAHTIAQDEASCVVFGMPKEAIRAGGVDDVLALSAIPEAIVRWTSGARRTGSRRRAG